MSARTIAEYRRGHWTNDDERLLFDLLQKRERLYVGRPIRRAARQARLASLLEKIVAAAQRMHQREELIALCLRRCGRAPPRALRDSTVQARVLSEAVRDLRDTMRRPVVSRAPREARGGR